jgi:hypothetical protein
MVNFIQQSGVERETLYLSCIKEYSSNSREREFVDWNAKFIDHFTPGRRTSCECDVGEIENSQNPSPV